MNPTEVLPASALRRSFDERMQHADAVVAVVGLGYVGLPLAVAYAQQGFRVVGIDIDAGRVGAVNAGTSPLGDVPSGDIGAAVAASRLRASADYADLRDADVIYICVPTPCTRHKEPDTSHIRAAVEGMAPHLRSGQVIILRSTSYPGTTEELVRPILEAQGHSVGRDVFVAFAPERVDPGRSTYTLRSTPVLVAGCDPESTRRAGVALQAISLQVIPLSSPAAAEMAKLLENVFRNVNIALVNQLAMLCDRMGLDIWEIIGAAATKPFGFMSFQPGPGVGGHCIPVDPYYLAWKAREYDFHMEFVELAARVNEAMPYYVVNRLVQALDGNGSLRPRHILVLGVAFKRDVEDARYSPALKVIELLLKRGAEVQYHDPYVPSLAVNGQRFESQALTAEALRAYDCVAIITDHSSVDYAWVVHHARLVFDTRNVMARIPHDRQKVFRL